MWKTNLLLCAALIGCHSSMDDMSAMRGNLADMRYETDRHLAAARGATAMQHVRDEMRTHRDNMAPIMMDMDAMMDSMAMHCDGMGAGGMRAMHGDLEREMTQHFATMDASTELAATLAEVERHAARMLAMMDGMGGAMGNVRCR